MKIIVVGGGAAGLMAATAASQSGAEVTLLEQNEKLGKKIYITGKGRCNLTNACTEEELIAHTYRGGRFLYSALSVFDNRDAMDFFEKGGCPVKTERGNRVFPVSDHASDVTAVFERKLKKAGVRVCLNTRVRRIISQDGRIRALECQSLVAGGKKARGPLKGPASVSSPGRMRNLMLETDRVIIATGGLSYPSTGARGDGYEFARSLGHTVGDLSPSLVGLHTRGDDHELLEGLTLKNVAFTVNHTDSRSDPGNYSRKKNIYSDLGEMLFTARGISGPLVLRASSHIEKKDIARGIYGHLDLKPGLEMQQLEKRILRDFDQNKNKQLTNVLRGLYPGRLTDIMIKAMGLRGDTPIHQINSRDRQRIAAITKDWCFEIIGQGGFEEAVITRGGVSLKEIDPRTMASRLVEGLYFAGEILDIDAATGGFNLQAAWSTGYVAGLSAASE